MASVSGFSDSRSEGVTRSLKRRHPSRQRSTLVASLIAERALADRDGAAILDVRGDHAVRWRELAGASETWRTRSEGDQATPPGDVRIGLVMTSPVELAREYLAALAAGVTVVPLDPACSEAELLWRSAALGLTHVMGDGGEAIKLHARSKFRRRAAQATPDPVALDPFAADPLPVDPLAVDTAPGTFWGWSGVGRPWHPSVAPIDAAMPSAEPDHPALVAATKGSTGAPKLVPFSETQLLGSAARVVRHFGLGSADRGYVATPMSSVDSQVVGLLAMLLSGGSVVVDDAFDGRNFWAGVEASRSTWLNLEPAMISALSTLPAPGATLRDRVRFVRVGGAAVPLTAHSEFWQSTGISLIETYTLTEAAGPVTANPLDIGRRRPGSAGLPTGAQLRIVDSDGTLVSAGTTGRVLVRGATVSTRYLSYGRNRDSMPTQVHGGWFDTGDLGCLTQTGYLYLAGRAGSEADLVVASGR